MVLVVGSGGSNCNTGSTGSGMVEVVVVMVLAASSFLLGGPQIPNNYKGTPI